MKNKTIANLLIASFGLALIAGLLSWEDSVITLIGLFMLVASVFAIVRLYKTQD